MKTKNQIYLMIMFYLLGIMIAKAQYCTPAYSYGCGDGDGLVFFHLSMINQPISCSGNPSYYHDYSSVSTSLTMGVSYTLSVQAGYTATHVRVWIDYNDNNTFNQPEEIIVSDLVCPLANAIYSTTITIPSGTQSGNHRLRFRTNYAVAMNDPCTNFTYGNSGDFTVEILPDIYPYIVFTPLQNTTETGDRFLSSTITGTSGIPISGTGLPVLYWKINRTGAYNSVQAVYAGGSQYTFTFGGGVTPGDSVFYYIVAQDLAAPSHIISNPSAGAGGYSADPPAASNPPASPCSYRINEIPPPVASITPDPAVMPLGGSINLNGNPTGGSGVYTSYLWTGTGAAYLNNVNIVNPTFSGAPLGVYSLTFTVVDNGGHQASDNIDVTISPSVQRTMVVQEIATGIWSYYDPGAQMGADDLLANGCQVAVIGYHYGDQYANTASNARNTYYNIWGYPTAKFDGILEYVGGSHSNSMYPNYLPLYNSRYSVLSPLTIGMSGHSEADTFHITLTIDKVGDISATNLKAHLVLTESHIPYNWQGQSEVNHAERAMAPDAGGTAISFSSGNQVILDLSIVKNGAWDLTNCELIAFVQDNDTKEILNGNKAPLNNFYTPMYFPGASITPDPATMHVGGSINLDGNPTGGSGVYTNFQWTGTGSSYLSDATIQAPVFSGAPAGSYNLTFTVTDNLGNTGSDNITILVYGNELYVNDWVQGSEIWCIGVPGSDDNPGTINAPFFTITHAIGVAEPGNTIYVDQGTYTEQITITKSLHLKGAGYAYTSIYAPDVRIGTVVQGTETWDYILTAYAISGTIDVSIEGLTVDGVWHDKMPGTDNYAGMFVRDVNGIDSRIKKCTFSRFPQTSPYVCDALKIMGNSFLTVDSNTVYWFTRDGISVVNGNITISNNNIAYTELGSNGIVLKAPATGSIRKNRVMYLSRPDACGYFVDGSVVPFEYNYASSCYNSIKLKNVEEFTLNNNTSQNHHWNGLLLENVNVSFIRDNSIQDPLGTSNAAIMLTGNCTGNWIGGEGHGNEISQHIPGSGTIYGIYLHSSLGEAFTHIIYNNFEGGHRGIQIDSGVMGETTIDHNVFGTGGFDMSSIVINGGRAIISNNDISSGNTHWGIVVDGANTVHIIWNTFNYGNGINFINASGGQLVGGNSSNSNLAGTFLSVGAGIQAIDIDCNSIWGPSDIGIIIQPGCYNAMITNNNFKYITGRTINTAIIAYDQTIVNDNIFEDCDIGIDSWKTLEARNNKFVRCPNGAIVLHSDDIHYLWNNYWGYYGPKILNSTNQNTYYPEYQGEIIQANGFTNFTFSPWIQNADDQDSNLCGYQPDVGSSYAPVYANTDGSSTEMEQYGSIMEAINETNLPYLFAKAGTFREQVLIQKNLTLTGAGIDQTYIKPPLSGRFTTPGYSGNIYPGTSWNADYLLAAYPTDPVSGSPINVKVSGFTFHADNQTHIGDKYTGVFFRKVFNSTAGNAGLFNSRIMGFNDTDPLTTGVDVLDGSKLTLDNNLINDYTKQGIEVNGTDNLQDPFVVTSNNTFTPYGNAKGIRYSNINGTATAGEINSNTINQGSDPIAAVSCDHILIDPNHINNSYGGGIKLSFSNNCTVKENVITNFETKAIEVTGNNNVITGNTITDNTGNSSGGIYLNNANGNTLIANTISSIHSEDVSSIGTSGWGIGVDGTSANNSIGDGTLANSNYVYYNDAGIVFNGTGTGNTARGNRFYYNEPYGLNNHGGAPVNATGNWWRYLSGPTNAELNPCGSGELLTEGNAVTFSPWKYDQYFDKDVYSLEAFNMEGTTTICTNVTTNITLSGSQGLQYGSDYFYMVFRDGSRLWGWEKDGTGGALTWQVTETVPGTYHYTVKVYNKLTGCELEMNGMATLTVNPVPTISGSNSVCKGNTGIVYTTESGMTGYTWSVSAGGTITSGIGTATIHVNWNTTGEQSVSVNYTNSGGCNAASASIFNVMVNPLPDITLTGTTSVCNGSAGNIYTTDASMTNYTWTIPIGATVTAGGTSSDNTVTITWASPGTKIIQVNYSNGNGCSAAAPKQLTVTVKPSPIPTITGTSSVCVNVNAVYSTVPFQTNYVWTISPAGIIVSGQGTKTVTVKWTSAGAQWIGLSYTGLNGCSAPTPTIKNITVNPCKSDLAETESVNVTTNEKTQTRSNDLLVYPNPNDGTFTFMISATEPGTYRLRVFSNLGFMVYEVKEINVKDVYIRKLDLRNLSDGVYNIMVTGGVGTLNRRVIIRK